MKIVTRLGLLALLVVGLQTGYAAPVTLNFDTDLSGHTLVNGNLLNNVYGGLGVTFNSTAVVIASGGGVVSQPNFATGAFGNFNSNLVLVFDNFADSVGAANVTSSDWTLTAFDANSVVLGTIHSANFPGFVSLSGIGAIKTAVFSTTSQYGIDNLTFNAVANHVPEPGTLVLLSLAMVGLVVVRRRAVGAGQIADGRARLM